MQVCHTLASLHAGSVQLTASGRERAALLGGGVMQYAGMFGLYSHDGK